MRSGFDGCQENFRRSSKFFQDRQIWGSLKNRRLFFARYDLGGGLKDFR